MSKRLLPRLIDSFIDLLQKTGLLFIQKSKTLPLEIEPGTILAVANTALGDLLLCTPALQSLRSSFPNAKIAVLIHRRYIPLFEKCSYIDTIVPYHGGYRRFFSTVMTLRRLRPDTALIFHGNAPQDIQLCALSGATYLLKHPTRSPLRRLLSVQLPGKKQHTIEEKLDLVRAIGGKKLTTRMAIGPMRNKSAEKKFAPFKDAVGFQMGAADRYKMWPVEYFAEIAKRILDQYPDRKIVLTGIASEKYLGEELMKLCPDSRIHNLCGDTSIEELPYLLKSLSVLLTNDTGTMHLAIALEVPTLSLFSATLAELIGPYQDRHLHRVIQKDGLDIQKLPKKKRDNRAMKLITVDNVWSELEKML